MSLPPLSPARSLPNITTAAAAHFFDLRLTPISQLMPPEIWAIYARRDRVSDNRKKHHSSERRLNYA